MDRYTTPDFNGFAADWLAAHPGIGMDDAWDDICEAYDHAND